MLHDASVFRRIDQVTRAPRSAPPGSRPLVIGPGVSRYQRMSAKLPAPPGSLRSESGQPARPPAPLRRRALSHPAPNRTGAAVRRALDALVGRRHRTGP